MAIRGHGVVQAGAVVALASLVPLVIGGIVALNNGSTRIKPMSSTEPDGSAPQSAPPSVSLVGRDGTLPFPTAITGSLFTVRF